jgi:hypothetical protein
MMDFSLNALYRTAYLPPPELWLARPVVHYSGTSSRWPERRSVAPR